MEADRTRLPKRRCSPGAIETAPVFHRFYRGPSTASVASSASVHSSNRTTIRRSHLGHRVAPVHRCSSCWQRGQLERMP